MSLLQLLQQAQNGQGLSELAGKIGIDSAQAGELTALLAPVIGKATKTQAESGGLSGIIGALQGEDQAAMYDNPIEAVTDAGQAQGASFLNGILGNGGADSLAAQAAERTGIDLAQVSAFLPALAAMAQGGMQKTMPDAALNAMAPKPEGASGIMGLLGGLMGKSQAGAPDLSMLTSFLDADGDGSMVDDIMEKLQG